MSKVAIIGAGFSGSILAWALKCLGINCIVFEKARGVGGRMAAQSIGGVPLAKGQSWLFQPNPDWGASLYSEVFKWLKENKVISPWKHRGEHVRVRTGIGSDAEMANAWVLNPKFTTPDIPAQFLDINGICAALLKDVDVITNCGDVTVSEWNGGGGCWRVDIGADYHVVYDVAFCAPLHLLADVYDELPSGTRYMQKYSMLVQGLKGYDSPVTYIDDFNNPVEMVVNEGLRNRSAAAADYHLVTCKSWFGAECNAKNPDRGDAKNAAMKGMLTALDLPVDTQVTGQSWKSALTVQPLQRDALELADGLHIASDQIGDAVLPALVRAAQSAQPIVAALGR